MKKRKNNNGIFYVVISLVAILGVAGVIRAYQTDTPPKNVIENVENFTFNEALNPQNEEMIGGGRYESFQKSFTDGIITGGASLNASTTLTAARTITAAEICSNSYIHVNSAAVAGTVAAASLDLTFAATSSLFTTCLTYSGAEKTITFRNNSPTTASTTEMVAGTGCELRLAEETGADNDIEGLNEARITFRRTDDAYADGGSVDCIILVEETVTD